MVADSLKKTGVNISSNVQSYLSKLLEFYIFSDHLFSELDSSGKKQVKTLAELYLHSYESKVSLKNSLQKMGDTSLYISGFFRESLKKKLISADYYINMGRQAYFNLSNLEDGKLFKEMSSCFPDLVSVLFQIRKNNSSNKYNDLFSLLDQYMETGSSQIAKDLVDQGLNIPFKKNWKKRSH